jgi:hypothetical protein
MGKATQEGVIIIFDESGEPEMMVRRNGSVVYYKLVEMKFGDHAEFLKADVVATQNENRN